MKRKRPIQYTLRGVPERLDSALRRWAKAEDKSLNEVTLDLLAAATGVADSPIVHHDLDSLAGTWVEDKLFDEAILAQDHVDLQLWK